MLAAHMDEVGLMTVSRHRGRAVALPRAGRGGFARADLQARARGVRYPEKASLPGVIGAMAIHQQTAEDRKTVLPIEQLYIDIGARTRPGRAPRAREHAGRFPTPYTPFGDEAGDRQGAGRPRVGVYNLLKLLDAPYDGDLVFRLYQSEESGCRGTTSAGYRVPAGCGAGVGGRPPTTWARPGRVPGVPRGAGRMHIVYG